MFFLIVKTSKRPGPSSFLVEPFRKSRNENINFLNCQQLFGFLQKHSEVKDTINITKKTRKQPISDVLCIGFDC